MGDSNKLSVAQIDGKSTSIPTSTRGSTPVSFRSSTTKNKQTQDALDTSRSRPVDFNASSVESSDFAVSKATPQASAILKESTGLTTSANTRSESTGTRGGNELDSSTSLHVTASTADTLEAMTGTRGGNELELSQVSNVAATRAKASNVCESASLHVAASVVLSSSHGAETTTGLDTTRVPASDPQVSRKSVTVLSADTTAAANQQPSTLQPVRRNASVSPDIHVPLEAFMNELCEMFSSKIDALIAAISNHTQGTQQRAASPPKTEVSISCTRATVPPESVSTAAAATEHRQMEVAVFGPRTDSTTSPSDAHEATPSSPPQLAAAPKSSHRQRWKVAFPGCPFCPASSNAIALSVGSSLIAESVTAASVSSSSSTVNHDPTAATAAPEALAGSLDAHTALPQSSSSSPSSTNPSQDDQTVCHLQSNTVTHTVCPVEEISHKAVIDSTIAVKLQSSAQQTSITSYSMIEDVVTVDTSTASTLVAPVSPATSPVYFTITADSDRSLDGNATSPRSSSVSKQKHSNASSLPCFSSVAQTGLVAYRAVRQSKDPPRMTMTFMSLAQMTTAILVSVCGPRLALTTLIALGFDSHLLHQGFLMTQHNSESYSTVTTLT